MSVYLPGDRSWILRKEVDCPKFSPNALQPWPPRRRHSAAAAPVVPIVFVCCAGGMAVQPPSSNQNEGLLSALSKQVDALCGAYTEKMRQLHSMLDMEEDSRERTARQTAAGRALWNHVIHDPLARFLAGESQLRKLQGKMEEMAKGNTARETAGVMLAVRTLWFDEKIEAALKQWRDSHLCPTAGATPQVVLLGAGMDTRAYRLKCLEGCNVFEVDLPKILDFKSALLKCAAATEVSGGGLEVTGARVEQTAAQEQEPEAASASASARLCAARLERVAADLATEEWWDKLQEAGFKAGPVEDGASDAPTCNPVAPTIWVLEGLLYYLKDAEALALLRRIACSCAAGTLVLADFMNEFSTHLSTELQTQFYFHSDWPEELLPSLGFVCVRVSQMGDPDANFGLIGDNPLSFFHRLRHTPRYCKSDADGNPCRRLFLVQCSVA